MNKEWIGVDLDGTLAEIPTDGTWLPLSEVGPPIKATVDLVKKGMEMGFNFRIFTARVDAIGKRDRVTDKFMRRYDVFAPIQRWCVIHFDKLLPITNIKDVDCKEIWDDRAVSFELNGGLWISPEGSIATKITEQRIKEKEDE